MILLKAIVNNEISKSNCALQHRDKLPFNTSESDRRRWLPGHLTNTGGAGGGIRSADLRKKSSASSTKLSVDPLES